MEQKYLSITEVFKALQATPSSRNVVEGERLLNAKHVILCDCTKKTQSDINIYALCLQSSALNDPPHTIEVFMKIRDITIEVEKISCSCKAGNSGKCKHIAAVLFYCTRNNLNDFQLLSATDKKCIWAQRKGPSLSQYSPVPLTETECFKTESNNSIDYSQIDEDLIGKLFPNSALIKHRVGRSRVTDEPLTVTTPSSVTLEKDPQSDKSRDHEILKKILTESNDLMDFVGSLDIGPLHDCCHSFYQTHILCDEDNIDICLNNAHNRQKWLAERQFRITGSRCYKIFTYKKDDWIKKATNYFWPKKYGKIPNLQYGQAFESLAREAYKSATKCEVLEPGLIISKKNPWLAYSPDGIVLKDGKPYKLLEIKCIIKGKEMTATEAISFCKYITKENGTFSLRKRHEYYGQVQLGIAILNLSETDFIIFASKDSPFVNISVKLDTNFVTDMLKVLKFNYFSHMLHIPCTIK